MTEESKSVFATLSAVDVNEHIEKKGNLSYLSWAWAWKILKGYYPDATYKVYEDENGWNYHTDGRTAWVKVSVTVDGIENIEYLPIMDYRNSAIPTERVSAMDVNKSIQRALTKAIARHGLGLYIYAGEDLPDAGDGNHMAAEPPKEYTRKKEESPRRKSALMLWESKGQDSHKLPDYVYKKTGKTISKKTTDAEWADILDMIKNDSSLKRGD